MSSIERRPDVDIEEEIGVIIRSYSPLRASRPYFVFTSKNGRVALVGNVRNPQSRRVLIENVPRIEGVESVDSSRLYDDEMIRFAVGQLLPPGIFASVHYGAVALTGSVPETASAAAIVAAVQVLPGVRRVGAELEGNASLSNVAQG